MSRCRRCRTPKWRGDPCPSADCPTNTTTTVVLREHRQRGYARYGKGTATAVKDHGLHALRSTDGTTRLVSDYDLPIHSSTWRTAS